MKFSNTVTVMPRKHYYITIEVEADTYGKGPTPNEVCNAIWAYLSKSEKDNGSIYIQHATTLSVMDEKGKNLCQ